MNLVLEIPDEVVAGLSLSPDEAQEYLRREIALALYRRGILTLGKARLLSEMMQRGFEALLGERGIDGHWASSLYDDWDDLEVDDVCRQMTKDDQPVS